ncbi:hypothetical protein QJS04_geneDACA016097 [Acorus gramineus]|uniref:Uncharacterized protein n=1 Tax=Acorus gramineus TaxID=55184 RepID=A0AAV9BK47_ACOGR|nr:hypothetical protein QJS04_geneDACA016097 [Acorus gramineus]
MYNSQSHVVVPSFATVGDETSVFNVNRHGSILVEELHIHRVSATPSVAVLKRIGQEASLVTREVPEDDWDGNGRIASTRSRCRRMRGVRGGGGDATEVEWKEDSRSERKVRRS